MLPNNIFILTNGSTILVGNDVWQFGPDQDTAPRFVYHRDDVEGGLIGSTVNIFAPLIISDAGVMNTLQTLLPKQVAAKSSRWHLLS